MAKKHKAPPFKIPRQQMSKFDPKNMIRIGSGPFKAEAVTNQVHDAVQGCGNPACDICMPRDGKGGGGTLGGSGGRADNFFRAEIDRMMAAQFSGVRFEFVASGGGEKPAGDSAAYRQAKEKVEKYILATAHDLQWDDVVGNEAARTALVEAIEAPIKHAELYAHYGQKPLKGVMLHGPPGCGKAQPLTAAVKTMDGWATIGDLAIGDRLASVDGRESVVEGVYPQGLKEEWLVTFSDGASVGCCSEHLWEVEHRDWSQPRVLTTAEIADLIKKPSNVRRLFVPLVSGDFGRDDDLVLAPYLLGALIGDGNFTSSCPYFSAGDAEILQRVEDALPAECCARPSSGYDYRIVRRERENLPNPVMDGLRSLGLWGKKSVEKFIPVRYLNGSKATRLALLKGLLDTDGYTEAGNRVSFSTSSERLVRDFVELVQSLGGLATARSRIPAYTHNGEKRKGQQSWVVAIAPPFARDLVTLERHRRNLVGVQRTVHAARKIVSVERSGRSVEMACIRVSHPRRLYVTSGYVVTHNTMFGKAAASVIGRLHGQKALLIKINGPEIQSPYVGVTEQIIRDIFAFARIYAKEKGHPLTIFIDEADAILPSRSGRIAGYEMSNVATFLTEMDGLEGSGAFVILATNRPEAIDAALLRDGRCDRKIKVERPSREAAREILRKGLGGAPVAGELDDLVTGALQHFYSRDHVLGQFRIGRGKDAEDHPFHLHRIVNGAMLVGLVERAKAVAFRRDLAAGTRSGLGLDDLKAAIDAILVENRGMDHGYAMQEFVADLVETIGETVH